MTRTLAALAGAMLLVASGLSADTAGKKKEESSFGAIRAVDSTAVQQESEAWLKSIGKTDAGTQAKFKAIWATDKSVLEKVSETIGLGDAEAAKLLAAARDEETPAPQEVPALLKDNKKSAFFRANLTLAYGRALVQRKVYEEALEALLTVKANDVCDPSSYLFHRAVCEHAMMLRAKADASIDRLLVDVQESPERFRMVASMMYHDMLTWQEKDLGWIARKMDNIQRRLDLQRGGKNTQQMQKEVLVRLDEMIKELENKQKQQQQGQSGENDGNCPPGSEGKPGNGPSNNPNPSAPMQDTNGNQASGTGNVDKKQYKEVADVWGKLPEKERERIREELRQKMSPADRAMLEAYIKAMQNRDAKK